MKRIALLFLIPFAFACESSTDSGEPVDVAFDFGIQRPQIEPAFMVQSTDDGDVIVRGYYEALCTPYLADAKSRLDGNVLILTVTGRASDACHHAITPIGYQARVDGVADDIATVRVMHEWKNTGRAPENVFEFGVLMATRN